MESLFVPISMLAGGLLAVQAGANAQLARTTGSPFVATTLQLAVAAVLLLALAAITGSLLALTRLPHVPWWHAVGGTASAFYVVSTILLFPRLGAVVSVGLFIAGQMIASFMLDTFGLLGVPAQPVRTTAILGELAVLAGATAIVLGQKGATSEFSVARLAWISLGLIAGAVLPVQAAVNALLHVDLGAPFTVGAVSFVVATLAMALVLFVVVAVTRQPRLQLAGLPGMPWWGWLGGFAGAIYVTTMFTAVPVIGVAAAAGFTIAGQQIASVFVDRYGWLRLPVRPISAVRLAGVLLLLAGVSMIKTA
jgi:transporter family-2 protein